jgi:tetratricopeptide (TPR) repeat protein
MGVSVFLVASLAMAQQRFDMLVREDFFEGLAGNSERFERAMKTIEDTLAKDPQHAEAKVWHGAGVFHRASRAFEAGDMKKGMELWYRGLGEMEEAVKLAPANVGVLIPRGAVLIAASRYAPAEFGKPLLETGVSDYEKVLKLQKSYFQKVSVHSRGELLLGLADGHSRLGHASEARNYFDRVIEELPGSPYSDKARAWLEGSPESKSPGFFECTGCHAR